MLIAAVTGLIAIISGFITHLWKRNEDLKRKLANSNLQQKEAQAGYEASKMSNSDLRNAIEREINMSEPGSDKKS